MTWSPFTFPSKHNEKNNILFSLISLNELSIEDLDIKSIAAE